MVGFLLSGGSQHRVLALPGSPESELGRGEVVTHCGGPKEQSITNDTVRTAADVQQIGGFFRAGRVLRQAGM